MRMKRLSILLALLACTSFFAKDVSWHHSNSPYRAVFDIKGKTNNPQCGVIIEVPLCGIGEPDGKDVYCYDENGDRVHSGSKAVVNAGKIKLDVPKNGLAYAELPAGVSAGN